MYRSIESSIWSDPAFKKLDRNGKLLFFFLITNDLAHLSGIYCIEPILMSIRTGIPEAELNRVLDTLSMGGLAFFDHGKEVVFVKSMFRYQGRGAKVQKCAADQLKNVHGSDLIAAFLETYPQIRGLTDARILDRVSDRVWDRGSYRTEQNRDRTEAGTEPEAETDQNPSVPSRKKNWTDDPDFVALKMKYPVRAGSNRWPEAYSAYRARIKEGHAWDDINAGVDRYLAFCTATHKVGTEKVLLMATFLGPNLCFNDPYTIPRHGSAIAQASEDAINRAMGEAS